MVACHTGRVLPPETNRIAGAIDGFMCGCEIISHMESDAVDPAAVAAGTEVMAAIDDGPVERFVLADISTDEAYLTVPADEAASLSAWR